MPQDKLSPWQDVLGHGEQTFLSPFVIKKGAKRKIHILTLPQKMYICTYVRSLLNVKLRHKFLD